MVFEVRSRILRCSKCGLYTLKPACPRCDAPTYNTFPPRFSPQDRYGKYRRMYSIGEKMMKDKEL